MAVNFKKATMDEVLAIEPYLRENDKRELVRMGWSVQQALRQAVKNSDRIWIAEHDGKAAAVFGVGHNSILGNIGTPWFLSTGELDSLAVQKEFLKQSPVIVEAFLHKYDRLVNYVDAEYTQAIRWLKWLGFAVGEILVSPITGAKFRMITMERV